MVKFRVFQNLSEQFLKIALSLKMTSNKKKLNYKLVANFMGFVIDITEFGCD
jgi:hypothetical protein